MFTTVSSLVPRLEWIALYLLCTPPVFVHDVNKDSFTFRSSSVQRVQDKVAVLDGCTFYNRSCGPAKL
jgi:hypothetical protein